MRAARQSTQRVSGGLMWAHHEVQQQHARQAVEAQRLGGSCVALAGRAEESLVALISQTKKTAFI